MKPSEFKINRSKVMMKKLLKSTEIATLLKNTLFLNHQSYRSQILIAEIEDFNEGCVKISRPYLFYFPRDVSVGPGRIGPFHCFK